jgi:hypothetical protein
MYNCLCKTDKKKYKDKKRSSKYIYKTKDRVTRTPLNLPTIQDNVERSSSANKTDSHDLNEILLKVALNTIKQTILNLCNRHAYI